MTSKFVYSPGRGADNSFSYFVMESWKDRSSRDPNLPVWPSKDDIKEYQRRWNKLTDGVKRQYRYKLDKEKRKRAESQADNENSEQEDQASTIDDDQHKAQDRNTETVHEVDKTPKWITQLAGSFHDMIQLAPETLMKFNGNCEEFKIFWTAYAELVRDNRTLTTQAKFRRLRDALQLEEDKDLLSIVDAAEPDLQLAEQVLKDKYVNSSAIDVKLLDRADQVQTVSEGAETSSWEKLLQECIILNAKSKDRGDAVRLKILARLFTKMPTRQQAEITRAKVETLDQMRDYIKQQLEDARWQAELRAKAGPSNRGDVQPFRGGPTTRGQYQQTRGMFRGRGYGQCNRGSQNWQQNSRASINNIKQETLPPRLILYPLSPLAGLAVFGCPQCAPSTSDTERISLHLP